MLSVGFSLSSCSRMRVPFRGTTLRKASREVLPMQSRMFRRSSFTKSYLFCCGPATSLLSGKLCAQHFNFFDGGWLGEQVWRFLHKRFGYGAGEMSLPSAFVGERVEYSKGRRPESQREPYWRGYFLIGHRKYCF